MNALVQPINRPSLISPHYEYFVENKKGDASHYYYVKKSKISRAIPVFGKEKLRSFSENK
jgi:hypothetical protein